MAIYKQIQAKFWQNDFVLDLTSEERYFYLYLITNTMTTLCGIYRFNLKLAVLETGLSSEVINKHLNTFESSKKIIISKTSKEIIIVNWLKHNSKLNKRTISTINAELKEVKDKELLGQFFEICKMRQCPIDVIFKGIILPSTEKEERKNIGQALPEASQPKEKAEEEPLQRETNEIVQAISQDSGQQKKEADATSNLQANNIVKPYPSPPARKRRIRKSLCRTERKNQVNLLECCFQALKILQQIQKPKSGVVKQRKTWKQDVMIL